MRFVRGFWQLAAAAFCAVAVLATMIPAAQAANRVAFVVGNAEYTGVTQLANPGNDALDMSVALEGLGFEVILGLDLTEEDMTAATARFARAAAQAEVALFYYAGHAFQAEGRNYLLPVDATFTGAEDLLGETIDLAEVLAGMEDAPGLKLVFLDACRDNPFKIDTASDANIGSGLTRVGTDADFLLSFSTQPNNVAYDGTGRNSFFTEALLHHLYTPGQDVTDLMIAVRRDVLAATGGRQIPWDNSSLTRQFVFDTRPPDASEETLLFQVAAQIEEPELFRHYLDRYPQGSHVEEVAMLLDDPGASLSRGATLPDSIDPGERLWSLARRSRSRTPLQVYLTRFPQGEHAPQAARLLELLPEPDSFSPEVLCRRLATHPRDATPAYPGVPLSRLRENATPTVRSCSAAVAEAPEQPELVALLARAVYAAGDLSRALALYRRAAAAGDLRAQVSLGLLYQNGIGVSAPDPSAAVALYEQAAEGGSPDGMINLAVALFSGTGTTPDPDRAVEILRRAAEQGSARARFNLGVLARDGTIDTPADALDHFLRAARTGEPQGWGAAGTLVDQGFGVPQDHQAAADYFLRAVAEDDGQTFLLLRDKPTGFEAATIRAMQERLAEAGLYDAALDGQPGPGFLNALRGWRNGGFVPAVLRN